MSAHHSPGAGSPDPASGADRAGIRVAPAPRLGAGSWLLASAPRRMAAAVIVSAALWVLTGWAMGWW